MEKIIMFLDNNPCEDPNILIVVSYVRNILETVFTIIPIVLIVLITFDIVKNVSAGNEDAIKQNQKIIIKRIIYSIALFFVVPIVNVVFSIFGTSGNIQLINGDVENQKLNYLSCWDNAKNKKTIDSFTIFAKFEGNGGKVNGTNEKRCGGSSSCEIILPNATKEGSRFIGWDINPSCNNAYKERILTIKKTNTSNVTTLYACFEEQETIEENISTENNTNNNKDNNTNNNTNNNKDNNTNNNTNNNKDNNTNNNTNNNLQKHIIFVGDSRMCGIYDAVDELSTESFVCEIGKSIQWFNDSAIDEINNIIKKDSTKKYVIIINLGVNNPYNGNAEQYYESYNELKNGSWSNHDVIITSVDPVDETRYDYVSNFNTIIEKFNTDLKDNLNSNIKYCDTYSYVKELIKDSNYIEPDGLHYKSQTYSKIYTKLKECAK